MGDNFLRPNSIFTCHPVSLVKIFVMSVTMVVVGLKLNTYPNPALVVAMDEPVAAGDVMLMEVENVVGRHGSSVVVGYLPATGYAFMHSDD